MTPSTPARVAGLAAAGAAGVLLGGVIGVVAAVRRDRPMHAVGRTHHVVLHRSPVTSVGTSAGTSTPVEPAGVPWLDRPGEQRGLVRFSRGAGLPAWAPDVQGVALRLTEPDGGRTDVLLSSTGLRGPARFVLVPRRSPMAGPSGTLMPFHGPHGPVLLAVEPVAPSSSRADRRSRRRDATPELAGSRWRLLWSGTTGPWREVGVLTVGADAGSDVDRTTRFHPIGASPPGLPPYRWAAALRAPAYRAARLLGRGARG